MVTAVTLIKHNILSVHKIIPHRQHGPMDKKPSQLKDKITEDNTHHL